MDKSPKKVPRFNTDYLSVFNEGRITEKAARAIKRSETQNGEILIVAPCLIGDFVALLPAIAAYIQKNEDKRISLIVSPSVRPLAQRIRGVGDIHIAQTISRPGAIEHDPRLEGKEFEEVILLRSSHDVLRRIAKAITARTVRTATRQAARWSSGLLRDNISRRRPTQWRDFNFSFFGIAPESREPAELIRIDSNDREKIKRLCVLSPEKLNVIVHLSASWIMNQWPLERWAELLMELRRIGRFHFIIIGAPKDEADFRRFSELVDFAPVSLIGAIDTLELATLIEMADFFLGVDSGPGNIAHLVNTRSLILYGPGPHTFMSHWPDDAIIDRSRGRGLYQRFVRKSAGFIHKITVSEAAQAFLNLTHGKSQRS